MLHPVPKSKKPVLAAALAVTITGLSFCYSLWHKGPDQRIAQVHAEGASVPAKPADVAAPAAAAPVAAQPAEPSAAGKAGAKAATRSKEQATGALMALPELRAWSALLEKKSGGSVHGALVEYDPAPRQLNGKRYWQFSFVESSPEALLRWESFLLSSSDDEILVDDAASDSVLSLERWRKEKHPLQRSSAN